VALSSRGTSKGYLRAYFIVFKLLRELYRIQETKLSNMPSTLSSEINNLLPKSDFDIIHVDGTFEVIPAAPTPVVTDDDEYFAVGIDVITLSGRQVERRGGASRRREFVGAPAVDFVAGSVDEDEFERLASTVDNLIVKGQLVVTAREVAESEADFQLLVVSAVSCLSHFGELCALTV
jgi:hypothetical protein